VTRLREAQMGMPDTVHTPRPRAAIRLYVAAHAAPQ